MQPNITYNTNNTCNKTLLTILTLLKILPLLYLEFILKSITIVTKLSVTFLVTSTLTLREDAASLSLLLKQQCLSPSTFLSGTTLAYTGQLSGVRMFDIHVTFVHFKFYPWTFQEVPKTTPASKLAAKAATVPEIPVRDSKPSPKKLLLQKRIK